MTMKLFILFFFIFFIFLRYW